MGCTRLKPGLISLCLFMGWGSGAAAQSPWLTGLHWYATDGDVESLTGNRGVWLLENVNISGGPSASGQKAKFQTAVGRGHTIIVRLQPQWGLQFPPDAQMPAYLAAVRSAAAQLADEVHIWQIGNEMDNYAVENGGVPLPPAAYAAKFRQVRAAIRQVSSPLGPQMVLAGPTTAFSPYFAQLLQELDLDDVDGFAVHAYGVNPDPAVINSLLNFRASYTQALAAIDARGFHHKPVFITEFDRCTDPANDAAQEATSAQFLHQAYAQLANWNATPGNHPIAGCIWFIYPDDSNWSCFSIRRHKSGPRGEDVNLWDAFQHAAGQGHPSGMTGPELIVRVPGTMPPQAPAFHRTVPYTQAAPADNFEAINAGAGIAAYEVVSPSPWLLATPALGTSSGESDVITVQYDATSLPPGTHATSITLYSPDSPGPPITVPVNLRRLPPAADMDGDLDVDLDDFGRFQRCLSGNGQIQGDPACELALLDDDFDVDAEDLGLFLGCLSGPGSPSDPHCTE